MRLIVTKPGVARMILNSGATNKTIRSSNSPQSLVQCRETVFVISGEIQLRRAEIIVLCITHCSICRSLWFLFSLQNESGEKIMITAKMNKKVHFEKVFVDRKLFDTIFIGTWDTGVVCLGRYLSELSLEMIDVVHVPDFLSQLHTADQAARGKSPAGAHLLLTGSLLGFQFEILTGGGVGSPLTVLNQCVQLPLTGGDVSQHDLFQ